MQLGDQELREEIQKPGRPSTYFFSWHLSMPRKVRAELKVIGQDFRREDVEQLKKQITLLEEAFRESEEQKTG